MEKALNISFIVFCLVSFLVNTVYAHPGRTASDGCHYCRTNCDKWGVPWNTRHCHRGFVIPTSLPLPTKTPMSTPVPTATEIPPEPTSALELENEVKGESVSPTDIPVQTDSKTKDADPTAGLIALGALGAGSYWLIRKLQRKSKKENFEPPQDS